MDEIRADTAYPVRVFCKRVGMSAHRVRNYVPVRRVGGRAYVLGSDFIDYLKRQPKLMPQPKSIDRLLARTNSSATEDGQ
jgi:hypothetical protein